MLLFILILLLLVMPVYSNQAQQESDMHVKEIVVVTASKTDTLIKDVARSVIVINKEEIEKSQAIDLIEIIKQKTGIHIAQNGAGPGSNTSLFVRGANSNYNLILLDGVPLNMAGGDYDLGDISLDNVQKIEIVKGPVSVIYGPYAASAVINIITKKEEPTSTISFAAGNYNTFHELIDLNLHYNKYKLNLYGSRLDSKRQLEINNEYYRTILGARFDYEVSENSNLNIHFRLNNAKDNYPTGSAGDRFMTLELYDPDQYIKNNEIYLASQYSFNYSNWQPIIKFSYTRLKLNYFDADSGALIDPFGEYYGNDISSRYIIEMQNNINFKAHLFTAGIEYQKELFDSINNYSVESFIGRRTNIGMYLQDQWHNNDKLFITSGIRFDKNNNYKVALSPQISISYKINADLKLISNIGLGFKAPSFWQTLGGGFTTGNPNLKPEKVASYDAGFDYFNKKISMKITPTFFINKFYDLIEYEPHFDASIPDYQNIGRAYSYGIELEIEKEFGGGFSSSFNSSYIIAKKDSQTNTEIEKLLLRRPKYSANLSVRYSNKRLTAEVTMIFVGKRVDLDYSKSMFAAERVWNPSYYIINIAANYKIREHVKATIRLENLLNKHYEEVFGYTAKKRSILLGVDVSW